MCLTEHWRSEEEIGIYTPEDFFLASSYCRDKGHHGGCAIFIKQGIECLERPDIKSLSVPGVIECCACQIEIQYKKYLIVCVYRPNSQPLADVFLFFEKFSLVLDQCFLQGVDLVISGDFNIDILSHSKDAKMFLSIIETYNLELKIKEPTRITTNSATCLDNIISSIEGKVTIVEEHLSDHSGQKFVFQADVKRNESRLIRNVRIYNESNHQLFENLLDNVDWSVIFDIPENRVNDMWAFFSKNIDLCFNSAFPIQNLNVAKKRKINSSPEIENLKKNIRFIICCL